MKFLSNFLRLEIGWVCPLKKRRLFIQFNFYEASFLAILILAVLPNSYSQTTREIGQSSIDSLQRNNLPNRTDTIAKVSKRLSTSLRQSIIEQPIYRTPQDSITLEKVESEIRILMGMPMIKTKSIDSLLVISNEIRSKRIIGFRKSYLVNPDFFPFDSLGLKSDHSQIKRLSISRLKSRRLPAAIFTCTNLEELELVNTSVERIQRKLRHLRQLKSIVIYNNRPKRPLVFKNIPQLNSLTIRGNAPTLLPVNYSRLSGLAKLDLANNSLVQFPKGLSKNIYLKELILSNNLITLEGNPIRPNEYLEKLDLGKNQIKKVPFWMSGFSSLKILKFNYNSISAVDEKIALLKKLEQLSFYNNQLHSIPSCIYELPALKEIDLYYNQIEKLEPLASHWKKLEVLYLAFNKVHSLPDNLGEINNLQELYIHNNRLSSLPESIGQLHSLKVLRFNNNFIIHLPNLLSQLKSLQNLDLSHNSITSYQEGILPLSKLKIISLVANPWDDESKKKLNALTKRLREQEVIVHLYSFDESIE